MLRPHAGLQAFHNGVPYEFVMRTDNADSSWEVWEVKPLFVLGENRTILYRQHDRLTRVHSGPLGLPQP